MEQLGEQLDVGLAVRELEGEEGMAEHMLNPHTHTHLPPYCTRQAGPYMGVSPQ